MIFVENDQNVQECECEERVFTVRKDCVIDVPTAEKVE